MIDGGDNVIWVAVNDAAGAWVGAGVLFCSDLLPNDGNDDSVVSLGVWTNSVDCSSPGWPSLNKFVLESAARTWCRNYSLYAGDMQGANDLRVLAGQHCDV
jgi:hypothetical protein